MQIIVRKNEFTESIASHCTVAVRFFRSCKTFFGPPSPRGAIVFTKLDVRELRQQSFRVSERIKVEIDATGSIDERRSGEMGLAAYPWITRDDTGEVMWKMDNSNAVQEGSLAHVVGDEPVLD